MGRFLIQPHGRLQEWVAEELGLFADEGLDYEFTPSFAVMGVGSSVQTTDEAPVEVKSGAFEDLAAGRTGNVSSACHWAVNAAAASRHGRMYGHAYSLSPSGIFLAPDAECCASSASSKRASSSR